MKKPRALPHIWPKRRILAFLDRMWVGPGPSHCWLWCGGVDQNGYGRFALTGKARSNVQAHRVSYAMFVGEVPSDMTVDHKCENHRCVRPSHLQLKTAGHNSATRYCKTGTDPLVIPALEETDNNGDPNEPAPF